MKNETAVECLERMFGKKETYTYYETAEAMIEYAYNRIEMQHEITMKILNDTLNTEQI